MFSRAENRPKPPSRRLSPGTKASPAAMALAGEPGCNGISPTSTDPARGTAAPKISAFSCSIPDPTRPLNPTISPGSTEKVTSRNGGAVSPRT